MFRYLSRACFVLPKKLYSVRATWCFVTRLSFPIRPLLVYIHFIVTKSLGRYPLCIQTTRTVYYYIRHVARISSASSPLTPTVRDVYTVRAGRHSRTRVHSVPLWPCVVRKKERRESGSTRRSTATMNTTRPYRGTARTTLRVIAGASRSRRCADAGCAHAAAHDAAATSREARSHSLTRTHACAMHAPTRTWLSTYNYSPLSFFLFLFLYVYAMRCRGW